MRKYYFLIVTFLTFKIPEVAGVETSVYRKLGSTVELSPGPLDGPIRNIEWKHESDIAVEWFGDTVIDYRQFKGCSMLNQSTGHLIIYNVTLKHSGRYSAAINSKTGDSTSIKVIAPVPKPTVSIRCNTEKTHCLLTCEGNIIDDNGPVSYTWTGADGHLPGNETFRITEENRQALFSCQLENPVSSESSEPVPNPLSTRNRVSAIVSVVLTLITVLLVFALVTRFRGFCNRGMWGPSGLAGPAPSTREAAAEANGMKHQSSSEAEREELLTNQQTSAPNGTSGSSSVPEEQTAAGPQTTVTVHQEDGNDTEEQSSAGPETKVTVHQEDSNETEEQSSVGPETKVTVHQEDSNDTGPEKDEDAAQVQN